MDEVIADLARRRRAGGTGCGRGSGWSRPCRGASPRAPVRWMMTSMALSRSTVSVTSAVRPRALRTCPTSPSVLITGMPGRTRSRRPRSRRRRTTRKKRRDLLADDLGPDERLLAEALAELEELPEAAVLAGLVDGAGGPLVAELARSRTRMRSFSCLHVDEVGVVLARPPLDRVRGPGRRPTLNRAR